MQFAPQSEQELEEDRRRRMKLLKAGEADFVVKTAVDKLSNKDQTEMIELQVEVTDADGVTKVLRDWLHPAIAHKIRHFCYAVGLGTKYENGTLEADDCVGRGGRCVVSLKKSEQYGDQNEVRDYLLAAQTKQTPGYQAAKTAAEQKPTPTAAEIAKAKAWRAYKTAFPDSPVAEQQAGFRQMLEAFYPAKKVELLSAAEWDRFVGDGFVRKAQSPIEEQPVFKDEDVPF